MKPVLTEENRARLLSVKAFFARCGIPDMFMCRFVGLYFIISGIILQIQRKEHVHSVNHWKDYIKAMPTGKAIAGFVLGFIALTAIYYFIPKKFKIIDQILLFGGTMFFSLSLMLRNDNYYLAIGVSMIAAVFISYLMGKVSHEKLENFPEKPTVVIIFSLMAIVLMFVALMSVYRHKVFGSSTYDFGIFAQMFYSMKEHFTAVTTCERDKFLSHFNVHASFIYYLLLPVYALVPKEETLLVSQAVLVISGVIPLYLIVKNRGFNGAIRIAACVVYIFYGGLVAPCFYDYHENSFLPTLLMWLMYAVDRKKYILFYIMSALTCIVKEDAPLYVICISLYVLIEEKGWKRLHGLIMMGISGIYFILINKWLGEYGDGEMMASTRFGNLTLEKGDSLMSIVSNVLKDPGYFFSLLIQERSLMFFFQIMFSLMFLPFMTRKLQRYLLMIPFIIMNLVVGTSYAYAAQLGYQYIFGPSCLLIYLAIVNASELEHERRNTLMTTASVVCVITAFCLISGRISGYESYKKREDYWRHLEECLDRVPQDARVIVNTWFLPHLADREEVYIFDKNDFTTNPDVQSDYFGDIATGLKDMNRYDFYVLSTGDENTEIAIPYLQEGGFRCVDGTEDYILMFASAEWLAAHPDYEQTHPDLLTPE